MESLSKNRSQLENLILSDIMSRLKPGTPKEINDWELGVKENYLK